ncbi:MAG: rhodanese-like domain-containing protein [Paraglaciecola polaris]|uniref:rhodanese-like domain-containing protein n=1 Tax=Paraglaciecola polaris TaxID=222814 RepID=UPI003002FFE1|tara:strand:+ start:11371 stop:12741 length:1371 start_codon:yes stop_codon:yes gene_type:complete
MFIQTIKTSGLAHLSYFVASGNKAVVIDPRRDIDIYLDIAQENECDITHIIETHRNEDLISGAPILSELVDAEVLHGPNADGEVLYATTVKEGHQVRIGNLTLEVIETPGHTKDSICILVFDNDFDQGPVGIFTGDTLFVGDVGRTDFYPEENEHVAGLLYDSLQKIKAKAAASIIYPAHGAGSVCGDGMAEREFSTVQHEIMNNPLMGINERAEFIQHKITEHHYTPPYFSDMERLNMQGAPAHTTFQMTPSVQVEQLKNMYQKGYVLIDVRPIESYLGAHIPNSCCLPIDMITAYAGWLFSLNDKLVIIADDQNMARYAALHFARIGFDNIEHYFSTNMAMVAAKGSCFSTIDAVNAEQVKQLLNDDWHLLDVRKITEYEPIHIEGSEHIFLGHLADKISALSPDDKFITMCASGIRATVAAAYLQAKGYNNVKVFLGSIGAWQSKNYPVIKPS